MAIDPLNAVAVSARFPSNLISFWLAIFVDVLFTSFLLALFAVPMYRVYQQDLGVLNDNQLLHRMKLKRLLMWCVVLTFINQISSTLYFIPALYVPPITMIGYFTLLLIRTMDPPINVWTSWMMITRNRKYLQTVCCCQCVRQSPRGMMQRAPSTMLTDIQSQNSRPQNELKNHTAILLTDIASSLD